MNKSEIFYFRLLLGLFLMKWLVAWEDDPDRHPTKCETCKFLVVELMNNLNQLNSGEYLDQSYNFDELKTGKTVRKYKDSESRLVEAMGNTCRNILQYQVHSKRPGSLRFSKDEHPSIKSFKEMRLQGAEIDIGIPYDLWDSPSVEIMRLKKSCDLMLETHEEVIEEWFMQHKEKVSLAKYFCEDFILKNEDKTCLKENKQMLKKSEL